MARRRGGPPRKSRFIHSKAQQRYIFGVLAKRNPKAKVWGRKWAHRVGETGGRTPSSRAAYRALPRRVGVRKRV